MSATHSKHYDLDAAAFYRDQMKTVEHDALVHTTFFDEPDDRPTRAELHAEAEHDFDREPVSDGD